MLAMSVMRRLDSCARQQPKHWKTWWSRTDVGVLAMCVYVSVGAHAQDVEIKNNSDLTMEDPVGDDDLVRAKGVWGNPLKHKNYREAWARVNDLLKGATAITIAGHGGQGMLCVGNGAECVTEPEFSIVLQSLKKWPPAPTRTIGALRLLGCQVGGGTSGRDLVITLANALGTEVSAPP